MVFSIKVMPPGALVPAVPSTPVDEEHRHARPDFHFAVEATDDSTFADLRTRALQYIADDQADYLRKHPAASFGELKLERGTTLRSRQRVATIFPHHTSPEEIVLLLYHTNEPPPQAQKRKAPEPSLPTPDTSKRRKGKERATEPEAGSAAINAIQRIMSSQSAQRSPAAVANDPKQAPHWSLDEDRAFLPYILAGKSVRDALELAGLDGTRSQAAGRNRRKFYVDKNVTLDNLEEVRVQSARGRRFATFEDIPDSTQFPQKSSESATSKRKKRDLSKPKKPRSGGPTSMPPPARHALPQTYSHPRVTALPIGTKADSTQSTDDALLDLLDDLSDNEPTVVHNRMEVSESDESPQATHDRNDGGGADRVVETQREGVTNDAAHHDGDGDEDDVIEFEDMTGSVDEEVPRSDLELRGERLVEVWPGEDEYPSDFDGTDDEDVATTYVRVSEAAYQRMLEVGEANRRAFSNRHDAQHDATAADQLDSGQVQPDVVDHPGPGRPDLPLPTIEPEEPADDQPQQITRPPRRHAPHLTDEALKAECRKKCVYHDREGPWYLDFLVYQRELQYARDDGDEDRARTLISDFDHLDMKYRRKFFKIGPELFDNYDDWAPMPLVMRPGDDVPQLCYSQRELRIQKEAFDRREEELRRLKKAAEHLNEIELQDDARRRAMGGSESVGGEGESEDEQYYTVPTSAQKPREELREYNPQVLLPPKLLKAKLSKLERKTLNRAAKRAAKVASARVRKL
ncbi:hypothetical protein Tdes44962_MAKER04264 [Teratosphaeria destructans]|uniref:Uncharacterized protein n=1 Tax=Teratosphaeria destructans TaxID=418781 RepID=A0A9W7SMX9_9PEZI|nr:hypothetical protein Tdes44962_MAKER04264 [Teratosphaeria destructans]